MNNKAESLIRISETVSKALADAKAVVALESTVIAHGLPFPLNIETARQCEESVRREGAAPATIGIVEGRAVIGLSEEEINIFAHKQAPDGQAIEKVGLNNLAGILAKRGWGATTVAGTLKLAHLGGMRVFATGGIGGVHRGAESSFDISADLVALSTIPLICVSAGAKAILDLPGTVEYLETLGVPIVGFATKEFPAFYSRQSGLAVDIEAGTPDEVAEIALTHWQTGSKTSVLVCAPVPQEFEIPAGEIDRAIEEANREANQKGVRGKAVTPFLLSRLEQLTEGRTLRANRALLVNNAQIAARIAVSLSNLSANLSN
jgi:pseudouridine-5'-phosphate glycosidase